MYISEDWRLLQFLFLRLFRCFPLSAGCRVAPASPGVFLLRPPPVTALPLFIAFLRHGHEVGGDAVSEVKTIRAAAIGPKCKSRLQSRALIGRSEMSIRDI